MENEIITVEMIIKWIYQRYMLIFLICFLGSFVRDISDTIKNKTKIDVPRILASSITCSIILAVLVDYINNITISLYVLICFFTGMWSNNIMGYIMNWKFVEKFVRFLFKNIKNNVAKSVSQALDSLDDEEESDKENKKKEEVPK